MECEGLGTGTSTPVLGIRFPSGARRAASSGRGPVVLSRPAHESSVLSAVRRQIEAFEEKVGGQISEIQRQSDRPKEAAYTRLEEKLPTAEGTQLHLDRRIAELAG